ncbi:MAG: universal stress protein [Verrucomicrobiota bacterium]|jgi:nucleotide-binding universal stress UspA family protein|nr:MAG: universal stress protein [Verrucomicrobiota bacterium]
MNTTLEKSPHISLYPNILVTLDGNPSDRAIIDHIKPLASASQSHVTLFHVADGWAARTYGKLAISSEISSDEKYLETIKAEFLKSNILTDSVLAFGEPAKEIIRWAESNPCNLIAMSTHGHAFFGDFFLGSTSREVRHAVKVPVLLLKA